MEPSLNEFNHGIVNWKELSSGKENEKNFVNLQSKVELQDLSFTNKVDPGQISLSFRSWISDL